MNISYATIATERIKPHPRNPRTHSKKQVRQIAASISAFEFLSPMLVDENYLLIAGHGRLLAAQLLKLETVPVIIVPGLSDAQEARADDRGQQDSAGRGLEPRAARS